MEGCVVRKKNHTKAIFVFGRFQPPTIGHSVIINEISEQASRKDADGYVFVSSSQDRIKNPLTIRQKLNVLLRMYPDKNVTFVDTTLCNCKQLFSIVDLLKDAGYTELTFIVGSDRVIEFQTTLAKYHPDIHVTSIGDTRIDDDASNSLSSVSGTRLRGYALSGNKGQFEKYVKMGNMTTSNVTTLMKQIQNGMKGGKRNTRKSRVSRTRSTRRNLKTGR